MLQGQSRPTSGCAQLASWVGDAPGEAQYKSKARNGTVCSDRPELALNRDRTIVHSWNKIYWTLFNLDECVCVCAIGLTIVLRNLGKSNLCKSGVLDLRPGEKRLLECS